MVEEFQLPGGSRLKLPVGTRKFNGDIVKEEGETHQLIRGCLHVRFALRWPSSGKTAGLSVFCTHLDHINDGERRIQLAAIVDRMKVAVQSSDNEHCILCGDLNALCRRDYSEGEW